MPCSYRTAFADYIGNAPDFSDSLFSWVLAHLNYGLRESPSSMVPNDSLIFFSFSTSFFILINLILGAIISGTIIDAFGALRDQQKEAEREMNTCCTICSHNQEYLEQHGTRFHDHISVDHNMWNYMFYVVMITELNADDCSGIQMFVRDMYETRDTCFFPIKRSLQLDSTSSVPTPI